LLCAAFEALVGAIYLDAGFQAATAFLEPRLKAAAEAILDDENLLDPRSRLQIWAQGELGETPRYRTVEAFGPDHAREFVVEVVVGESVRGRGRGRSKQEAAKQAAADVLSRLGPWAPGE
jgi:ribonuclease-3